MQQKADSDIPCLLEVRGEHALQIWEDLDAAVNLAIKQAVKTGRHGVLVTQHSNCHYTVALSNEVPYGETHERRLTCLDEIKTSILHRT